MSDCKIWNAVHLGIDMYKVDVCKLASTCCSDISARAQNRSFKAGSGGLFTNDPFVPSRIEAILRAVDVTMKDGMRWSSSACSDLVAMLTSAMSFCH